MMTTETVPRAARRTLFEWVGRLADRLADLRDQARHAAVEAAGRTVAEAAEAALRRIFAAGVPAAPARPPADPAWDGGDDRYDASGPWADDGGWHPVPPAPPPAGPRLTWRAAAAAALHAACWWLRRLAPTPALAAAAAVAGAALLLLD